MRQRLFKMMFLTSLTVSLICIVGLAVWLILSDLEVGFLNLFVPLLLLLVLALTLSAVLAFRVARKATSSLRHINVTSPDERDVEEEIRPLVRRLNDQNKQIRSQMEALALEHERQDRMRQEFTANVSHELKTPLTSISGIAELLRDGLVRPEDVQPFAGKIYDEAQRLISLVGDIIRLSRLEDPSVTVRMEPVSLYQTAERVCQQLFSVAEKQQITLTLRGDQGLVTGSPRIIEEIVYNLCENAVQYNHVGGTVEVEIREEPQQIRLTVRDNGIGVAQEELERIFERFYRVDKSHSKAVGGTGLGLSIVKHGAASLGAAIQVESELGKGTTISVTFPKERL
ncbi:MAG: ATP-binding protein [Clostridia bacterium]|nr:ATP-binding protein [Clostridia bacterium]